MTVNIRSEYVACTYVQITIIKNLPEAVIKYNVRTCDWPRPLEQQHWTEFEIG